MSKIGFAIEMPDDEELLRLAETGFEGELPVPYDKDVLKLEGNEREQMLRFYKTAHILLTRIQGLERRHLSYFAHWDGADQPEEATHEPDAT